MMTFRSRLYWKLRRLQPLWHALSPRRRRQLLGLQLLSLAAAAGEVANLGALLPFLRLLADPQASIITLGPMAAPLRLLPSQHLPITMGLGFILVVVLSTALRVVAIRAQLKLGGLIAADLGERVFAEVLRKPFAWHLQQNSSSVLTNVTTDVDQMSGSIQGILALMMNLAIVVLLGSSLISLAPVLMLLIIAMLAIFYLIVFRVTRQSLRTNGQLIRSGYQGSMQVVQEALGGIRDVVLDRSQPFFVNVYRNRNRRFHLSRAAVSTQVAVPRYMIEGFAVILIVGISLSLSLSGEGIERQLPLLGTITLGAYRLLQPVQQCFNALGGLQANQPSIERLAPFLGEIPTVTLDQVPTPANLQAALSTSKPIVEMVNVSFRYSSDGPWVLQDLNLSIQSGERLAFVGTTGSGKSTTTDLVLGLLDPSKGRVLVYGHNLQGTPGMVASWQRLVAHVPQQIYLSDSSFAANIAFGVPEHLIEVQRVREAAEQARIAELIESSPEGYDTNVGERGVRLSGGQRQRIGIARALYKKAELLVLDEATSALDNRTEAEVMKAIEGLDRRFTVILIAHRLSTVESCDRIVLLDRGRISGIGTYRDLESGNISFKSLLVHQTP